MIILDLLSPTEKKINIHNVHIYKYQKIYDMIILGQRISYYSNNQGTCNILPLTPVLVDSEVSSESRKTSPPLPLWS